MKLDDNYEIQIVAAENNSGNIYRNIKDLFDVNPDCDSIIYGFVVVDSKTGLIPDNCHKWNYTVEGAIDDWLFNCIYIDL